MPGRLLEHIRNKVGTFSLVGIEECTTSWAANARSGNPAAGTTVKFRRRQGRGRQTSSYVNQASATVSRAPRCAGKQ
jgi:hypothetical protein